ncbi:MAG: PIG-L deacetylase family protein [Armatimonadota bacterium]
MPVSLNAPLPNNDALREKLFSAKRVLFIGAHPDDIEFYCAGLVYLLRMQGVEVTFAIATRGGKGYIRPARTLLEAMRTRDQLHSAEILGSVDVIFHNYPDKALPDHIQPFTSDIKALISDLKPDIIFSWDPDFIYNPHPDHQAAADAVRLACEDCQVCYYGTREPNLWIGFGSDILRIKLRSIRAHRTETPWFYWRLIKNPLMERLVGEGAKVGEDYAEILRIPECW